MEIRGRDLSSGLPRSLDLSSTEVLDAIHEPLDAILAVTKETLEQTPPELAADIAQRGILLAGGGSLLRNFAERCRVETGMPAHLADDPLTCVAEGAGQSLEELSHAGAGRHAIEAPPHRQQQAEPHASGLRLRRPVAP